MKYIKRPGLYFAITMAVFEVIGLLIAIPSHPECGTAGIDYMPCGYWDRVNWFADSSSIIGDFVIAVAISLIIVLAQRSIERNRNK